MAATICRQPARCQPSFNTQPPEGSCGKTRAGRKKSAQFQHTATRRWLLDFFFQLFFQSSFNTQPPEGGCIQELQNFFQPLVSTHSHPKVAAAGLRRQPAKPAGFNTQPPEGGCAGHPYHHAPKAVSTHSHPKVAAHGGTQIRCAHGVSTHSHPKVAASVQENGDTLAAFQHTATRRWLLERDCRATDRQRFNTQPPEGGCAGRGELAGIVGRFNTQPPEGGCGNHPVFGKFLPVSTHSHPKVAASVIFAR